MAVQNGVSTSVSLAFTMFFGVLASAEAERRLKLVGPLAECEKLTGAHDCPKTKQDADTYYQCIRGILEKAKDTPVYDMPPRVSTKAEDIKRRAEVIQQFHVIAMLKQLCQESKTGVHGLMCTTTTFWEHPSCETAQQTLRFPIVGDWGATQTQMEECGFECVSEWFGSLIRQLHKMHKFDFVINVGDNVYADGITSAGARDAQFEEVLKRFDQMPLAWYGMLGNHDYGTKGSTAHQMEYTTAAKSGGRWVLPEPFYTFTYTLRAKAPAKDTTAHFVVVDTQLICGKLDRKPLATTVEAANAHLKWMQEQLTSPKAKSADYLFLVGHYQVFSIKRQKQLDCMQKHFGPEILANQYHVSAYISGHLHLLQHFIANKATDNEIHYVLSGEGANIYKIEPEDRSQTTSYEQSYYHGIMLPDEDPKKVLPGVIHVELGHNEAVFHFTGKRGPLHDPIKLSKRQNK